LVKRVFFLKNLQINLHPQQALEIFSCMLYAEVDVEKLYEFLQENVEDFEIFAKYIAEYLENI